MVRLTDFFITRVLRSVVLLVTLGFCPLAIAEVAMPFEAVYEVFIDGKPRMEARISLARQGEEWLFSNELKGTGGLAKFLNARSSEQSRGIFTNDEFQPFSYSQSSKIAGRNDHWTAEFDWPANIVVTHHEDGESTLEAVPGTVDPLSLTLILRHHLAQGISDLSFEIVDEEEIDHHIFLASEPGNLETALGCFETVSVSRVRENSKRYSSGWYAVSLDFLPLKLLHGKRGGKEFEMRIKHLVIDGEEMSVPAECPA